MNKKKLTTGLVALGLVGVVGIGGSLAWFTDKEDKTNTFTTNHVDIKLTEDGYTDNQQTMPGTKITKDPTIVLEDKSSDAYVRIKDVKAKITKADKSVEYMDIDQFAPIINEGWVESNDGNYYYQYKLTATQKSTTALFNEITVPMNFTNDYANCTIEVVIVAEAVQADNFDSSLSTNEKGEITGWLIGNEQVQKYTLTK